MIVKRTRITYEDLETRLSYGFEPVPNTLSVQKIDSGWEVRYLTLDEYPESPDNSGGDNLFLVHYHRDFSVTTDECDIVGGYSGIDHALSALKEDL